jgi:hypothetical protein
LDWIGKRFAVLKPWIWVVGNFVIFWIGLGDFVNLLDWIGKRFAVLKPWIWVVGSFVIFWIGLGNFVIFWMKVNSILSSE